MSGVCREATLDVVALSRKLVLGVSDLVLGLLAISRVVSQTLNNITVIIIIVIITIISCSSIIMLMIISIIITIVLIITTIYTLTYINIHTYLRRRLSYGSPHGRIWASHDPTFLRCVLQRPSKTGGTTPIYVHIYMYTYMYTYL